MRDSYHIKTVQTPIIPVVGAWVRETEGTLSLGQGMVSYPPPQSALQAIQGFGSHPSDHLYGSPLGHPQLLALIKEKLHTDNGIVSDNYEVMVTAGSNMAFLNVLLAICDAGDEIILPVPYYFNQEMAIRMVHCQPVLVATDAQYQLQLDALRAAITPKTRAIVTVSPNNPSGAVYSETALRAVNALCAEYGLYHISDEAYEYFVYDKVKHFSPASIASAQEHTISLYSLSKAYGFASWRVGYVLFPKALLASLLKVQDTNLICPPLISQQAAIGALQTGSDYCRQHKEQLMLVRRQVIEQLQTLGDFCQMTVTEGAFYVLLKLNTEINDLILVETLIRDFKVAVIPGCAFGLHKGCYLRLSYGMLSPELITIAMQRLLAGIIQLCKF
ncbi:MAG: pyridoxal phosphate-dependent aminotransferase [Methylococcaceae bacterium]